jgi:hypothetical protein
MGTLLKVPPYICIGILLDLLPLVWISCNGRDVRCIGSDIGRFPRSLFSPLKLLCWTIAMIWGGTLRSVPTFFPGEGGFESLFDPLAVDPHPVLAVLHRIPFVVLQCHLIIFYRFFPFPH